MSSPDESAEYTDDTDRLELEITILENDSAEDAEDFEQGIRTLLEPAHDEVVLNVEEPDKDDELRCLAWVGGEECPDDVHGVKDGVPLCEHHLGKSGFYQYPRVPIDEEPPGDGEFIADQ